MLKIWRELLVADAQPADWYGWLGNQAAHFALVGVPFSLLLAWLEMPSYSIPFAVAAVYGIGWEWLIQSGKDVADSLMDTAMVACGSAFTVALMSDVHEAIRVFTIFAALTAFGVARRT